MPGEELLEKQVKELQEKNVKLEEGLEKQQTENDALWLKLTNMEGDLKKVKQSLDNLLEQIPSATSSKRAALPASVDLPTSGSRDTENQNPANAQWVIDTRKYMFVKDEKRCVVALTPKYAATYAHGSHKKLVPRNHESSRRINGDKFTVRSMCTTADGKPERKVEVEVVKFDADRDFIILEALKGKTFYDADPEEETILAPGHSLNGTKLIGIGLSGKDNIGGYVETTIHGQVANNKENKRNMLVCDAIMFGGDSGGGLFDENCKLVGLVSASIYDKGCSRTEFVHAGTLRQAVDGLTGQLYVRSPPRRWEDD